MSIFEALTTLLAYHDASSLFLRWFWLVVCVVFYFFFYEIRSARIYVQ